MDRCWIFFLGICLVLGGCKNRREVDIRRMVETWQRKTVVFPEYPVFTYYGEDTLNYPVEETDYKLLVYVDSAGCTSCKLRLIAWREVLKELNMATEENITFLFYFYYNDYAQVRYLLKRDQFEFPVCFDKDGELNRLNRFPEDMMYQTFLLDRSNQVLALGNPVLNPAVRELYLKIVQKKLH